MCNLSASCLHEFHCTDFLQTFFRRCRWKLTKIHCRLSGHEQHWPLVRSWSVAHRCPPRSLPCEPSDAPPLVQPCADMCSPTAKPNGDRWRRLREVREDRKMGAQQNKTRCFMMFCFKAQGTKTREIFASNRTILQSRNGSTLRRHKVEAHLLQL